MRGEPDEYDERIWTQYKRPELIAFQIAAKLKNTSIVFDDVVSRRRWYFKPTGNIPTAIKQDLLPKSWGRHKEPT